MSDSTITQGAASVFGPAISLDRDDVLLSGVLENPTNFARALRTLGNLTAIDSRAPYVDYSRYQSWVISQYFNELTANEKRSFRAHEVLSARVQHLENRLNVVRERLALLASKLNVNRGSKSRFYDWLYAHNREAWFVLDPLITVSKDRIFFESFSMDESVYARVSVPMRSLVTEGQVSYGTTNIDYSVGLDRELARARSYRPLSFKVGSDFASFASRFSELREKSIALPSTWTAGFAQVSAAQSMPGESISISPRSVINVLAVLSKNKQDGDGRGLIFELTPGQPIKMVLQPWGIEVIDHENVYEGRSSKSITVWGRKRLFAMKDILAHTDSIRVHLLGTGMPSYWHFVFEDVNLLVGFTGWSRLDWSAKTRLTSLVPMNVADSSELLPLETSLKKLGSATAEELNQDSGLNVSTKELQVLLNSLLYCGTALWDEPSNTYVYREIEKGAKLKLTKSAELTAAELLVASGRVAVLRDTFESNGRRVEGLCKEKSNQRVEIEYDLDERLAKFRCSCRDFGFRGQGNAPCRHIIALDQLIGQNHG